MQTWIDQNAGSIQTTLAPTNTTTNTSLDLPMFDQLTVVAGGQQQLFVSSIQMYINVTSPRIDFFENTSLIHTIQNTGRYTGTSLQTFDIPHVNMALVTNVRITSTSTIDSNITWYGLQSTNNGSTQLRFTGNFTFDTVPLTIFDNATGLTSANDLTVAVTTNGDTQITNGFIIQPNIGYNFNPFYLTIPTFVFNGAGATTTTPVPFILRLTQNNVVVTTVNFNLTAGASSPNGILIPLTTPSIVPSILSNMLIVTPTTTVTSRQFLRGTSAIAGTLMCSLPNVANLSNLSVATRFNDNTGLAVNIVGTGVTIDPLFNPDNLLTRSPITFAPGKFVNFSSIFSAARTIVGYNPISYLIFQPTPNIVTFTQTSDPDSTIQSWGMQQQFNQNNAAITLFAQSPRVVSGLNPKSIFSQPISIFNYGILLPGRVVPFVNTYNFDDPATPMYLDDYNNQSFAYMNVTFTQNVILNSLDFGYVFPNFLLSNVTNAGYGAQGLPSPTVNPSFTITLTSIPRTGSEPTITYGSVQFVCRQNSTNAYRAFHSSSANMTAANDGTLLSIPFTTNAMTPLPTLVNSFTPAASGSNFTFNVGDQVRIAFRFNQAGGIYAGTPTTSLQFLNMVSQPEMLGALVCTPNTVGNSTFNPIPTNLWFSTNNATITADYAHTVQTDTFTFNTPTIIHGFRLTSFRLQDVSDMRRLRVTIFRNNTNSFQVYFCFNDNGQTSPLFIPFSYAEFARYAAIESNSNDIARINPYSIAFSRPQHPIFNAGDTLRIEISVTTVTTITQAELSPVTIVYAGNNASNTIAGRLTGIILNTPTITFQQNPQITPVFAFGTNTRRIPILIPTSNSTGALTYPLTSQEIHPILGQPTTQSGTGVSVDVNTNEIVTNVFNRVLSRVSIQAFQQSSTLFTSLVTNFPSNIDLINTGAMAAAISTATNSVSSQTYAPFNTWIPFYATISGFSFQFFGGWGVNASTNVVMTVTTRYIGGTVSTQTITFDTTATTATNGLDGKLIYVPFTPNTIINPTFVSNLTYSGQPVGNVGPGTRVTVSTNIPMICRQRPSNVFQDGPAAVMGGSLVFSSVDSNNIIPQNADFPFPTPFQDQVNTFNVNSQTEIYNLSNNFVTPVSDVLLVDFMIPNIVFNTVSSPAPTFENPVRITFNVSVSDGNSVAGDPTAFVYEVDITICVVSNVATFVSIPFNMPVPGGPLSREDAVTNNGQYYIESVNPTFFARQYFTSSGSNDDTSYSYPRIFNTRFINTRSRYQIYVTTTTRPFVIQDVQGGVLSRIRFIRV